ncbi:MAG: ATP-binding cassette domain-containing protein [Lachnospiraceae bacterium]|nr:ATP-binding cassette domain-containing protein [Lachnospiraceae bacterium]
MIRIEHLYKTYFMKGGDVSALQDVSLTIEDGEIYGVIGYSGAGKSTLVRCMNLLEKPDSGTVEVNGVCLAKTQTDAQGKAVTTYLPEKQVNQVRRGIGMIFQHFNLLDRSTVYDNIAYPLKYCGMSRQQIHDRVVELLELVDLKDKISAYPSQLSGGQKQRVAIARALANNPKVLLSDEATSALDPDATESILELLKKLNQQLGLTIVVITHEMAVVKAVCTRVAVMEKGRVVEEGRAYDVFAAPVQPVTRKFVNANTSLEDVDISSGGDGMLARLVFTGESTSEAVISQISRNFNVDVNIMLANVDQLQSGPLGKMIVRMTGAQEDIRAAAAYLQEKKISVEVLENE